METWREQQQRLADLAERQLFFVGGAPRSGTTWLQQILDAHPDVSCRGEGLFLQQLAMPLERMLAQRGEAIAAKNARIFAHSGGYPLPEAEDTEFLVASAILLALHRQSAGKACRAIGEKTPENVFLFPRLKRLFPAARFIGIARDPRDVLTSAWHFFHGAAPGDDEAAKKTAFIRSALPSINDGARAMIEMGKRDPGSCMTVTYEALKAAPTPTVAALFRFLGVPDAEDVVADCLARTSFARLTGGRPAGVEQNGSFFRKGVVGDWKSTLTPEMNAMVLRELGWMFPHFGWQA